MAKMQAIKKIEIMETVYEKLLEKAYTQDPQRAMELARQWIKMGV